VVLMLMGQQNGIQTHNPLAQHLLAEIRTGVYHDGNRLCFNVYGGSQAIVFRIWGPAYLAAATYHRYAA
jgi:hypothetical protein